MICQQNETFHYVHGLSRHGEHFGHQVTVALEEGDRTQLNVEQQSRHPGKGLQVLLSLIRCGSYQCLQTLSLNCHLAESSIENLFKSVVMFHRQKI